MRVESEAEILSRIEETRERMGATIGEIGDRVNPDRVQRMLRSRAREQVEEAKESVKQKARDTMRGIEHEVSDAGRGFWHAIRSNPVPAGMIGVGLAWLLARRGGNGEDGRARLRPEAGRWRQREFEEYGPYGEREPRGAMGRGEPSAGRYRGPAPERPYGEEETGIRERAGEAVSTVKGRAGEAAESVREKAADVKERATGMAHEAQDRVQHASHEVADRVRQIEHRAEDVIEDHPLATTMVAAALGFAAGLAVPESRREREFMGDARRRAGERVTRALHDAGEAAKHAARETAGESARAAVDQVLHQEEEEGPRHGGPMNGPGRRYG